MCNKAAIKKIKEIYQEYDNFIVYNVYNQDKEFLYRETESKIKTKPDLKEELDQFIKQGSQNWVDKKIII